MSQSTYSIRMDSNLKKEFDSICEDFGMSSTTAINIFAKAVVRERRIPFEIRAENNGMVAFNALRQAAKRNRVQDMSMEEIDEEIRQAREGIGE